MSSEEDELPLALLALASGQQDRRNQKAKKDPARTKGRKDIKRSERSENKAPDRSQQGTEKKPRVTYDRPGQTRPTPPENDPLRRYYTSLYRQQPESALAQRFCAQHGLMPLDEAEKWTAEHGRGSQPSQKRSQTSQSPRKTQSKNAVEHNRERAKKTPKKSKKGPSRFRNDGIQVDDDNSGDE